MNKAFILLLGGLALSAVNASASITFVQSLSSLNANDQFDWGQFSVGNLGSPLVGISDNGVDLTASNNDQFSIYEQGGALPYDWAGNFSPGDFVLAQNIGDIGTVSQPVTLTFGAGIYSAGFQVEPAYYGNFIVQLAVYDTSNVLLGTQTFNGYSANSGDGSAIFIGAVDNTPNIGQLVVNVVSEDGNNAPINGLGIDTLHVGEAPPDVGQVPEPASATLLLTGFAGLVLFRRLRRS